LVDIHGKPMIWWVWQTAKQVAELDEVYIATDDERIVSVCNEFGAATLMTSKSHQTGTDRAVEVAEQIAADIYVVIMGDEPLVLPEDITMVIHAAVDNPDAWAVMCVKPYDNPIDAINTTTQKLSLNADNDIIYMSRSPIPYPQAKLDYDMHKHVGIYAYQRVALDYFSKTPIGRIESIESSEMLRLIENRKWVKGVVTHNFSLSVDTEKDLMRVQEYLSTPPPPRIIEPSFGCLLTCVFKQVA
jgi:3-deoxy-manno-octulosonate cytidylyltransferase (CMP-KDO synthetase)